MHEAEARGEVAKFNAYHYGSHGTEFEYDEGEDDGQSNEAHMQMRWAKVFAEAPAVGETGYHRGKFRVPIGPGERMV